MESEDEDVIFENSVLHQVLMDIGVSDVQTEPRLQAEADVGTGPEPSRETNRLTRVTETDRSCQLQSDIFTRIFYRTKVMEEVHNYHRHHMLKWLISSQLLSEEDQMFLQSYVDEKSPTRDPSECLSVYTYQFIGLMIASLILVNVLCPADQLSSWGMLLLGCMPQVLSGLYTYSHALSLILLNTIWVLFVAGPLLLLKKRTFQQILSQLEKQDRDIKDVVMASVELLQLERKCLRLVKESELVARGFTIASQHHVASRSGQTNTSSSSDQLCPALREVMFSENVHVTQEVKKGVVKMLRGIPMICADSDFSTLEDMKRSGSSLDPTDDSHERLAGIESTVDAESEQHTKGDVDKEIGMDAHHRSLSTSELSIFAHLKRSRSSFDLTDDSHGHLTGAGSADNAGSKQHTKGDFSMETGIDLKSLSASELNRSVGLLNVYLSGFVRRLALCFYPENLRDKTINPYEATKECTEISGKAIKRATRLLKQSYTFHRAFHKSDETPAPRKVHRSRNLGQSPIYNLFICVNSLDLHLQSLLQITRNLAISLEDKVDKEQHSLIGGDEVTSTEIKTVSEDDRAIWEDILKRIKSSLESCKGCYEESVKHLCQKAETDRPTNGFVKEVNRDVNQSSQTKVIVVPAEDPVIIDQVFEAVVDSDEEEDYPETRRLYSTEQKVKHQEDREAVKRFRQELQNVVGLRAVFQRAREERALARARGEEIPDEEIQVQPFHSVLEQKTDFMKQNEDGFATDELQSICPDTQKQQPETNLVPAMEEEPKTPSEEQPTEKYLGIFSPVQINRKTESITFDAPGKEFQSSVNGREHYKDSSSRCCEQSSSYHSSGLSDQCSSNSSNHDLDSETQSDLSQRKCITSESSRTGFLSNKGENSKRMTDDSPPSGVHSMNFTKNIAMLAASQARTLTSSYLEEDKFGDDSSDSDDVSQGELCD